MPEVDAEVASDAREHAEHAIRLQRRIHELAGELDAAISLYEPHIAPPHEDPEAVARFQAELRRFRGGADIASPVILSVVAPSHTARMAVHVAAQRMGVAPSAIERNGTASKSIDMEWSSRCERCADGDARVTAAVRVRDGARLHLERERLCIDCYDLALADER